MASGAFSFISRLSSLTSCGDAEHLLVNIAYTLALTGFRPRSFILLRHFVTLADSIVLVTRPFAKTDVKFLDWIPYLQHLESR